MSPGHGYPHRDTISGSVQVHTCGCVARPLLCNRWVKQVDGVRASAHRKVPPDIFDEANITRETGGVWPFPHKNGTPQGAKEQQYFLPGVQVAATTVAERLARKLQGEGSQTWV